MSARYRVYLDTCMFSPLQLQPTAALRLAMNAGTETLSQKVMELALLHRKHRLSVVVTGSRIKYIKPFTYFSADFIQVDSSLALLREGTLLRSVNQLKVGHDTVVEAEFINRFVKMSGGPALDAAPAALPRELWFEPDDMADVPAQRKLKAQVALIRQDSEKLGSAQYSFRLSRDECELADQWQWVMLPSFVSRNRESMIFDSGDKRLSVGLRHPIARWESEWFRPLFLGNEAQVTTDAHIKDGMLFFLHSVEEKLPFDDQQDKTRLCAVAVEHFCLTQDV